MKNNVLKLGNYQRIQEDKDSLTLEETIDELCLKAKRELDFEPIPKNAKGDDWDFDDEELYVDNDGEALMGYPVYDSEEFAEEGIDGNVEVEKEIFFTEEGNFLAFYTVTEYDYCHSCGKVHCRSHRIVAGDQSLSFEETEAVLNRLSNELDEEPLLFE